MRVTKLICIIAGAILIVFALIKTIIHWQERQEKLQLIPPLLIGFALIATGLALDTIGGLFSM